MSRKKKKDRDGVRKRDDRGGRYEIQWPGPDVYPPGHEKAGKKVRHRELLHTTCYETAVLERAKRLQQNHGRQYPVLPNITLRHVQEKYMEYYSRHYKDVATKTQRVKRTVEHLGDIPLEHLTEDHVESFIDSLFKGCPNKRRSHRNKTANRYLSSLKAMIKWSTERYGVPEEVHCRIKRVKKLPESPGRKTIYFLDHIKALINQCEDNDKCDGFMKALILLARLSHRSQAPEVYITAKILNFLRI